VARGNKRFGAYSATYGSKPGTNMSKVSSARSSPATIYESVPPSAATTEFCPFSAEQAAGSIPDRFARQAALHANRTAVQTQRHSLTYRGLDQVTNRVARAILEQAGPGPGQVALLLAYDAELIIGLLGSLKAGKTYVPLDATFPPERSLYMLEDSQAQLILTDSAHHGLARDLAGSSLPVIDIDTLGTSLSAGPLDLSIAPDSPAYILYTSGSTGWPKGVTQTHRNILHCMMWYTNRLRINPADRLSLIFPSTYALAAVVTFSTLVNGAALYPCDVRERGIDVLTTWLDSEQITVHQSVPAVFRHFVRLLSGQEQFPCLRLVCLGGDVAHQDDFELYKQHIPRTCLFLHEFGATEALVCCVVVLDHDTELPSSTVPAGYPADDTQILILDESGQELGRERIGQIAIKSDYLTPGYWRQPALTAAAFTADPAGGSARIYRTGDLGRLQADGSLLHLGRTDNRVKLRGLTIEVAEIETALQAAPLVKEAAVIAQEGPRGDSSLVAYLVLHPGAIPTTAELRDLVSQRLPAHMIPAAFVVLDAIPLSSNGKVDRRALPLQKGLRLGETPPYLAPRDAIEEELASLWKDLLRLDRVGVHDDFFQLGGHSLLAAEFLARLDRRFGRRLPLATFLQGATIAYFARLIPAAVPTSAWRSLVPIRPTGQRPPLFLIHAVFGDVLCFADLAKALGPDQPCYGLQARGLDGVESPLTRVEDIARYYLDEIRTVQPSGPYCLGGLSSGATIAYEMARQLLACGEQVALLASLDGSAVPAGQTRRVDPSYALRFLANLGSNAPYWLQASARLPRVDARSILRRRLRTIRKALGHRPRAGEWSRYAGPDTLLEEIADILGLHRAEDWPEYRRKVVEGLHEAVAAYRPQPYPGRLVLFRARWQPLFSPHDRLLGWGKLARGGVTVHVVNGNHDTFLYAPNVQRLADHLAVHLAQPG
jgi:amino acid adenylation domain-containing protein